MKQIASNEISWETFSEGLWKSNPVFVMLLGTCPTLAVTNSAINAISMGLATTFVLVATGLLISLMRRVIPNQVRIATYILIIATFVTMVDYLIQAISLSVYNALGAFIQLIVVNCIILGRAEAYASKVPPGKAMINALGMGVGFTIALLCLGIPRELLGAGSLFGANLFGENFEPWVIMVLPPGGFLIMGFWLILISWMKQRQALKDSSKELTHAS